MNDDPGGKRRVRRDDGRDPARDQAGDQDSDRAADRDRDHVDGVISTRELLRLRRDDVDVPRDSEATASPDSGPYAPLFHRTAVRSFDDLQVLSLVPERLREDEVRRAIGDDDRAAMEIARSTAHRMPADDDCACHDGDAQPARQRSKSRGQLRRAYDQARRNSNPELAKLLGDHWGKAVEWDHPVAEHTRYWVSRLVSIKDLLVFAIDDLTIGHNAVFSVAPPTTVLWVRDIRIHAGGRLVGNGSYLKVRCRSVQGNLA